MKTSSQIVLLVAAMMISASIIYSANSVSQLLKRENDEISFLRLAIAELDKKLDEIPEPQRTRRMVAEDQQRSNDARRLRVSTEGAPQIGPDDAAVSLVAFSDFECPYCRRVLPTIRQIHDEYGDRVRVLFKHYPLTIHPNAMGAHIAAEAAHRQGQFWEMHDLIFSNPNDLSNDAFEKYANILGLDIDVFRRDVISDEVRVRVQKDVAEARRLGVRGTPGFFVNGIFISGARSFSSFKQIIDQELSVL